MGIHIKKPVQNHQVFLLKNVLMMNQ